MDTLWLKLIAAVSVFVVALCAGLLPSWVANHRRSKRFLFYGEFFSRGVFLGAGLIHILPDAIDDVAQVLPHFEYPLVLALSALTIFLLQFIEQGLIKLYRTPAQPTVHWLTYLLTVLLSIHSVIAGAALGLGDTVAHVLIIFIAIIAHKGAAAFSLGVNMQTSGIKSDVARKIMFLFACMTPLGIAFGGWFGLYLQGHAALLTEGLFNAVAAGTFLYIATFHHSQLNLRDKFHLELVNILYFGIGVLLMALVAIWV